MPDLRIAAVIPVKTFANAKTRLDVPDGQKRMLCRIMLEEVLRTVSESAQIERTVLVTGEREAEEIGKRFDAAVVEDRAEEGVNSAVALADRYLLDNGFDASIVLPQDIPYVKIQDIDFVLKYKAPPNFAIIVPSQRFDGTNALVRMPVDLMGTRYDEGSYKIHMREAKRRTPNAALVFARRIMWDVDNMRDLEFLLGREEKPDFAARVRGVLGMTGGEDPAG